MTCVPIPNGCRRCTSSHRVVYWVSAAPAHGATLHFPVIVVCFVLFEEETKHMKRILNWAWRGLFLDPDVYEEMRQDNNPFVEGLFMIVVVAVLVAVVGLVGTVISGLAAPNPVAVQAAVLQGLENMDWYEQMEMFSGPEAINQFRQTFDLIWQAVANLVFPNPATAAMNIILLPLSIIIGWLIYGVFAHLFARLLGGKASLNETLGPTAFAVTPQLFNLVMIFPNVVVGGVVGTWTLLCRYTALKTAHQLSWGRALAATLLPVVLMALLGFILAVSVSALLGSAIAAFLAEGFAQ